MEEIQYLTKDYHIIFIKIEEKELYACVVLYKMFLHCLRAEIALKRTKKGRGQLSLGFKVEPLKSTRF